MNILCKIFGHRLKCNSFKSSILCTRNGCSYFEDLELPSQPTSQYSNNVTILVRDEIWGEKKITFVTKENFYTYISNSADSYGDLIGKNVGDSIEVVFHVKNSNWLGYFINGELNGVTELSTNKKLKSGRKRI